MIPFRAGATAALALLLAGCAYFNTMYNAERRFHDAQRAHDRGDVAVARAAWLESIDKAAKSYRAHPGSRWADDALFLIGRARFNLGEFDAARAAMARLLDSKDGNDDLRAGARAYFGAASIALGDVARGAAVLDSAASPAGAAAPRFVRLWRARAAFSSSDSARGWSELDALVGSGDPLATEASLEMAARALTFADSTRARRAIALLLADARAAAAVDSLDALSAALAERWGPAWAHAALEPVHYSRWPGEPRSRIRLARAAFTADAGDFDAAAAQAIRIVESTDDPLADEARYHAARWRLASVDDVAGVLEVRALLLPAAAHAGALGLLRAIRTADVLLEFAVERAQPLGFFAAGELARDSLHAPNLARALFLTYAGAAEDTPWAGKALLAALELATSHADADRVRRRIAASSSNLYVRAANGGTDEDAFAAAEQRLDRSIGALRFDAAQEAGRREPGVALAIARLDLRMLVTADSIAPRAPMTRADSARRRAVVIDTLRLDP